MNRLPLTVISGYLGAGKTTLINRLLAEDHGMHLLVMVNDFGAINIDASLIQSSADDTIALTNGCVCCTMGADLFMALGDALDRTPRPDHLIIEASGIADPAAIANAAKAEPEMSYAGIITLVDGVNGADLLHDPLIAPQVAQQIKMADLCLLTKTQTPAPDLSKQLQSINVPTPNALPEGPLAPILFDVLPRPGKHPPAPHPAFSHWSNPDPIEQNRMDLKAKLNSRPDGIYRVKGIVPSADGFLELHCVGRHSEVRKATTDQVGLVALGLADRITPEQIDLWWNTQET